LKTKQKRRNENKTHVCQSIIINLKANKKEEEL